MFIFEIPVIRPSFLTSVVQILFCKQSVHLKFTYVLLLWHCYNLLKLHPYRNLKKEMGTKNTFSRLTVEHTCGMLSCSAAQGDPGSLLATSPRDNLPEGLHGNGKCLAYSYLLSQLLSIMVCAERVKQEGGLFAVPLKQMLH